MSEWPETKLNACLAATLRYGIYISALVILFGAILFIASQGHTTPDYRVFTGVPEEFMTISGITSSAFHLNPEGVLQLGLLLLIAVPIVRVLISVFAFAQSKDILYAMISLLVFLILLFSTLTSGI